MPDSKYQFTSYARKRLKKLPADTQVRIVKKIKYFCTTNPMVYADKLTDRQTGEFRFRVGNYRVVFDIDDNLITILDVGHRREIYR